MSKLDLTHSLSEIVNSIAKYISNCKGKPLLLRVVSPSQISEYSHLSVSEQTHRQKALSNFQQLPRLQKCSPSTYSSLLSSLYPTKHSLAELRAPATARSEVNHAALYRNYLNLPSPGVGHLRDADLEPFMSEMFRSRAFSKPNVLSSSSLLLYADKYLLKQFRRGIEYRSHHLNRLWQLSRDMEDAQIPVSDYERCQLIFMTFYRDRPDIRRHILGLASQARLTDLGKTGIEIQESPSFTWETYIDLVDLDPELANDIKYLNTLLFCALRHGNWRAEQHILSRIGADSFNRETYKILLDNHGMHRNYDSFERHLSALATKHIHLLDINLLNIIIRSLSVLGLHSLAIGLTSPFKEFEAVRLAPEERFLRQLTYANKRAYSSYLSARDQFAAKEHIFLYANEHTFRPILQHYCVDGGSIEEISELIELMEEQWNIQLSTQVFKLIFHAFTVGVHDPEALHVVVAKLLQQHDLYFDTHDAWIREKLNETSIPTNVIELLGGLIESKVPGDEITSDGVFLKLSNSLMRLIFKAYHSTYQNDPEKRKIIESIEVRLWNHLAQTAASTNMTRLKDEATPADLYSREELIFLKKSSLLELLDI